MNKLPSVYARVLRYNKPPREQSFEDAIDKNPLDSTNHLVYADWLDEHGDAEEAAFRRSLGKWFEDHNEGVPRSNNDRVLFHKNTKKPFYNVAYHPEGAWQVWGPYYGSDHDAILPEGVEVPDYWHNEPMAQEHSIIHDLSGTNGIPSGTHRELYEALNHSPTPSHIASWQPHPIGVLTWPSYRDMEEGFRRSFKANLKKHE